MIKMKKIFFPTILIIAFFTAAVSVFANGEHSASLEDVMLEIMSSQNVSEKSQIKCENVSDEQFEELGDAVMGVMLADEERHNLMDQMMGGEGSEALKAAHIVMGKNYLGCGGAGMGMSMMMGVGMPMDWSGSSGFNSMMNNMMSNFGGWGGFFGIGWIFMILFWVLIIVGIVALIKWLVMQGKEEKKPAGKSALDILKERYAKGEISKEEFEEKKKEIA